MSNWREERDRLAGLFALMALLLAPEVRALDMQPRLEVATSAGSIEITLLLQAAPKAVAQLRLLAAEPGASANSVGGHYDEASVDYTWPLVEIGVATLRQNDVAVRFEQEIDAEALGLDELRVESSGQAMDVWQFELAKADKKWKNSGRRPQRYLDWLTLWEQHGSADFLLGVSRKTLNELLGYRYESGLESQPARRGAVYLKTRSQREATSGLVILLSDRPQLDGQVTVVGKVTRGLDVAEEISRRPVTILGGKQTKRPVDPVPVETVRLVTGIDGVNE